MNQQQKNHVRNRIQQLVYRAREKLFKLEHTSELEQVQLGLKEKALSWPNMAELKERVLDVIDYGRCSGSIPGRIFPGWDNWTNVLQKRRLDLEGARQQAIADLELLAEEATDGVVLGDAADALEHLEAFEQAVTALASEFNDKHKNVVG